MQVTATFKPGDRPAWRAWLDCNHRTASESWLLLDDRPEEPTVSYLDAVEEALCFGYSAELSVTFQFLARRSQVYS